MSQLLFFCFPGHKDDIIANAAAKKIATALNLNVAVTAGIHWDDIDREGINCIIDNGNLLTETIIEKIAKKQSK